jgi:fimbrial chaperone protein
MSNLARLRTVGALSILVALGVPATGVNATTVRPLVIDLVTTGRGMNQIISVENTSATALPVELTVRELSIHAGETRIGGEDPGDIVVFPPQAGIQPGQTQTFRIQYVGDPALARSKHYYVTVAQVPVRGREGESGVQVVFNFQVLVNVGPQGMRPALRVQSAEIGRNEAGQPVPVVTLANDSATYGFLSRGSLRLIERDRAGREVFRRTLSGPEIGQSVGMGLINSGEQRRFALPSVLPLESGTIEVRYAPDR